MARLLKVCKECNKPFSINDKQQAWLNKRNLQMFERCRECREKRRTNAKFRSVRTASMTPEQKAA